MIEAMDWKWTPVSKLWLSALMQKSGELCCMWTRLAQVAWAYRPPLQGHMWILFLLLQGNQKLIWALNPLPLPCSDQSEQPPCLFSWDANRPNQTQGSRSQSLDPPRLNLWPPWKPFGTLVHKVPRTWKVHNIISFLSSSVEEISGESVTPCLHPQYCSAACLLCSQELSI